MYPIWVRTDTSVRPCPFWVWTEKSQKISKNQFKQQNINKKIIVEKEKKEKCYPLSFPILLGRDSTRALQSNPFQNPGGVGGYCERDARRMEILLYNFGYSVGSCSYGYLKLYDAKSVSPHLEYKSTWLCTFVGSNQ